MKATTLTGLGRAAEKNGWKIIGLLENPATEGTLLNGTAAIDRDYSPFGAGKEFASCRWAAREEDGTAFFFEGEYDLTREDALQRLTARADRLWEAAA